MTLVVRCTVNGWGVRYGTD